MVCDHVYNFVENKIMKYCLREFICEQVLILSLFDVTMCLVVFTICFWQIHIDIRMWPYFVYLCLYFCQKPRQLNKTPSFPLIRIRNLLIDAPPFWMYEAGYIFYRVHNFVFERMVCNYGISYNWKSKIRFCL